MNPFRLSLLQTAYDPAPDAMAKKYRALTADAVKVGSRVVILPELSLSSYFPRRSLADWGEGEPRPESIPTGDSCKLFAELAREHGIFVVGSLYERGGLGFRKQKGARFNTAVLFDPLGNLGAACRKQHLPDPLGHFESEYFGPGNSDYPVFSLPDVNMAMPTGYDQWFPELARIYALKGAELITYPSAAGFTPDQPGSDSRNAWATMLLSHAVASGVFVAAANRVGTEESVTFYGGSIIAAPDGAILAQGSRDNEEIVFAELDPETMDRWRRRFPLLLRREPETYGTLLGRLTLNKEPKAPSVPE